MKWMYCYVLAGLLWAGCSSKVYVLRSEAANMAKYRTFQWVDTRADENSTAMQQSAFAEISIRNAVREALEREGWKQVKENPDVLLGYDILIERSLEQQKVSETDQPLSRRYYNPLLRRWGKINYPARFTGYDSNAALAKEATLTLTMMDARTDEALWQGWTTERMGSTRLTEEEIEKTVHKILDKLDAE